jgi:2''-aminoglycoside nucleotidyltransferase
MNDLHIALIHQLFSEADQINMPLWLQGGWAIDTKLNRITREHEDIDIAYPGDRSEDFLALLSSFGCVITDRSHKEQGLHFNSG